MSKTYGERVLSNIMLQCERRGIPVEEAESFLAHVADVEGKSVTSMDEKGLKSLQQRLEVHFISYLEGAKRRGEAKNAPWPSASPAASILAAQAGVVISDVSGTGNDGAVLLDDVKKYISDLSSE